MSPAPLLHLADDRTNILIVQEPWLEGGKVSGLATREYKLLVASSEGKIRACTLAIKHHSLFFLHNYSDADKAAATVEFQPPPIQVLLSYMTYVMPEPLAS